MSYTASVHDVQQNYLGKVIGSGQCAAFVEAAEGAAYGAVDARQNRDRRRRHSSRDAAGRDGHAAHTCTRVVGARPDERNRIYRDLHLG